MFVGTKVRHLLLTGGALEPSPWRSYDIEIQRISEAQLANADGTPLVKPSQTLRINGTQQ